MTFRKTEAADLDGVMEIIRQAQDSLKARGVDQWQNGYPDRPAIEADIARGWSYVLADGERVLGTAAISFAGEPTYDTISQGSWRGEGAYAVMHRVAVREDCKGQGLAGRLVSAAGQIRIDTHRQNASMQRMLEKNGFVYCGIILLQDGAEAGAEGLCFDKLLEA